MKIGGNGEEQGGIRIFVSGGEDEKQLTRREACKRNSQRKSGSIFVGDLHPERNRIEEKREETRKKIAKLVGDQFAGDTKIDENQDKKRQQVKELRAQAEELNAENNELRAEKEALKEKYGVEGGSQEQKDLELMEKVREAERTHTMSELSAEELEEFAQLGPLTDYQRDALARDEVIGCNLTKMEKLQDKKSMLTGSIIATKNAVAGRPYKYTMARVNHDVEELEKAASGEIMSIAVQDAKEHMDEEMEKLQEKAEKLAEEKKKKEEAAEKTAEKAAEQEKTPEEAQAEKQQEITEEMSEGVQNQNELNRRLKKIMEEGELLDEDLKGLVVNENL